MIAHVAAAGENRGRIILHMSHGRLSTPAVDAALRVARAFQASVECLFVEDQQLHDLAGLPFTREISHDGRVVRQAEPAALALDLRCDAIAAQRLVMLRAAAVGVPQSGRVMRDTPVDALARACAEHGPWNVIALTAPVRADERNGLLLCVLTSVPGHTAVIAVGPDVPRQRAQSGPVVAIVESLDALHGLLRTAERLAATGDGLDNRIVLILTGSPDEPLAEFEPHVRLALAARDHAALRRSKEPVASVTLVPAESIAEVHAALAQYAPGFLVAHYGCTFFPNGRDPAQKIAALTCPVFIVR